MSNDTYFKGYIAKSASDIGKPFRTRYCTVSTENISKSDQLKKKKKRASFPLRQRSSSLFDQSFNFLNNNDPPQKRLVLTYYKKESKPNLGKFILNDCDFRDVSEGIKDFPFAVCIKLKHLITPRDLYLCFNIEEDKKQFLEVLQKYTQTKLFKDIEDFDLFKPIEKEIPNDENNPILERLAEITKAIRCESNNQEFDYSIEEFRSKGNLIRDSGYSTTNSRSSSGSTISSYSIANSTLTENSCEIDITDSSKTLLSCTHFEFDLSSSPFSSINSSNLNTNMLTINSEEIEEDIYDNINIRNFSI